MEIPFQPGMQHEKEQSADLWECRKGSIGFPYASR